MMMPTQGASPELVRVDVANLFMANFEISSRHKFASKLTPSNALAALKSEIGGDTSDVFKAAYDVYLEQFRRMLEQSRDRGSDAAKHLSDVGRALNINVVGTTSLADLPDWLARLRTLDMVKAPV